jgi:hypothetical protein
MFTTTAATYDTTVSPRLEDTSFSGLMAGDYVDVSYTSLSRCALIDNGPNLLLQSDEFDTSWSTSNSTVDDQITAAPDGTTTADALEETTANSVHSVSQTVTVSSAAADYALTVALKAGTRGFAFLQIGDGTSNSSFYVNLTTGAITNTATGGTWSNIRGFSSDLGNGWWAVGFVGRKTGASISLTVQLGSATAAGTSTYVGVNGADAIYLWRATLAQSSVPTRLVQTTTSLTGGTDQTGAALYTKGWPVSTSGLLLSGDWFEVNGELKQLTAPVNSDGLGLAYLQFRPGLAVSPADSDPVIVYQPFGRFIYPGGTRELENLFGIYGDCEMNLEEVYV